MNMMNKTLKQKSRIILIAFTGLIAALAIIVTIGNLKTRSYLFDFTNIVEHTVSVTNFHEKVMLYKLNKYDFTSLFEQIDSINEEVISKDRIEQFKSELIKVQALKQENDSLEKEVIKLTNFSIQQSNLFINGVSKKLYDGLPVSKLEKLVITGANMNNNANYKIQSLFHYLTQDLTYEKELIPFLDKSIENAAADIIHLKNTPFSQLPVEAKKANERIKEITLEFIENTKKEKMLFAKFEMQVTEIVQSIDKKAHYSAKKVRSTLATSAFVIVSFLLLLGTGVFIFINKTFKSIWDSVGGEPTEVSEIVNQIASGNFDNINTKKAESGIYGNVLSMANNLKALNKKHEDIYNFNKHETEKITNVLEAINEGNLQESYKVSEFNDNTREVAANFIKIEGYLKSTQEVLSGIAQKVEKISQGDLTVQIKERSDNDLLLKSLSSMIEKLHEALAVIKQGSLGITQSGNEMNSVAETISQGASEQAASVEEISASMEEMLATIQTNSENSNKTEKMFTQTSEKVNLGNDAFARTINSLIEIVGKIKIVNEIARKTDLLAVNASIEAARAGEHGKGFAVVATEIRKLAEQSQKAASEITDLSDGGIKLAEKSSGVLETIVPEINRSARLISEISKASREQAAGAAQINNSIQQLSQIAQSNSAAAEQMSSNSNSLAGLANELTNTIEFFKLHKTVKISEEQKAKFASKTSDEKTENVKSAFGADINLDLDTPNLDIDFETY